MSNAAGVNVVLQMLLMEKVIKVDGFAYSYYFMKLSDLVAINVIGRKW